MLEVIAPSKHFEKLKEFISMKLPSGFPVKIGENAFLRYLQAVFCIGKSEAVIVCA